MAISIQPAMASQDAAMVAKGLRKEDLGELRAIHGDDMDPVRVIEEAVRVSDYAWTVFKDDSPIGIFGLRGFNGHVMTGVAWALLTDYVDSIPLLCMRISRWVLERMHDIYPCLINMAWSGNNKSLRWLKALGFTVSEASVPCGPRGEEFYPIQKERKHV